MDLGRDGTPGVALIDYGADPGDDLDDPAVIARVHPAVGHTITTSGVLGMRNTMDADEYARAVCGLWTPAATRTAAVLSGESWAACASTLAPAGGSLTFGVDVAADGSSASIVAAALVDGRTVVELIAAGPSWEWVVPRWRELRARHRVPLHADPLGPAAALCDALDRARLPVELTTTGRYAAACETFAADVRAGTLAHREQPALTASALTTGARTLGERWVWDRRGGSDSSPLVAATLAAAGARRPRTVPTAHTVTG
jgi:voltage-gated potassium channel Kch